MARGHPEPVGIVPGVDHEMGCDGRSGSIVYRDRDGIDHPVPVRQGHTAHRQL